MSQTLEAIFDGAVLRPATALELEPNTRVRLTLEVLPLKQTVPTSFLQTARSLNLDGPADWSANLDNYLYGDDDQMRQELHDYQLGQDHANRKMPCQRLFLKSRRRR